MNTIAQLYTMHAGAGRPSQQLTVPNVFFSGSPPPTPAQPPDTGAQQGRPVSDPEEEDTAQQGRPVSDPEEEDTAQQGRPVSDPEEEDTITLIR